MLNDVKENPKTQKSFDWLQIDLRQGNLYTGERLLYGLCSHQPTVELAVGALKNIFLLLENNQVNGWLATAHGVPSPSPCLEISLLKMTNHVLCKMTDCYFEDDRPPDDT